MDYYLFSSLPYISKDEYRHNALFFDYLKDANIPIDILEDVYLNTGWLKEYKDLPQELWHGSLLKPYTYYYHSQLCTLSPPVCFDVKTGVFSSPALYYEPKIMCTAQDFVCYMYKCLNTCEESKHFNRDVKALDFLLQKYFTIFIQDISFEAIDVFFSFIDYLTRLPHLKKSLRYLSLIDLYSQHFPNFMASLSEVILVKHTSFMLRTGEVVKCRK